MTQSTESPSHSLRADVCVVGAGAAGLWVGGVLARAGADVLILEKTQRAGTKILASGGTRCNLTTTLPPNEAARLFGQRGERFLRRAFRVLPPLEVRARFDALGVPTVEAPLEKVFPASDKARDVRDALQSAFESAGGRLRFKSSVASVRPNEGGWCVEVADGARVAAPIVMLAAGGNSYPRAGTTGDGYHWLRALDLEVVDPVPALVPLRSPAAWVHELTGIALQDCEARLFVHGEDSNRAPQLAGRRRRPVVFTHTGLSGPGAMDLSEPVARYEAAGASGRPPLIKLDLFPDRSQEELRAEWVELAGTAGAPRLRHALELSRRLFAAICEEAGIENPDPRANQLNRAQRHALLECLKALPVPVDGTLGLDRAEVSAGGLHLKHVDPGSMHVPSHPGLYVFGELLDLTGPIGGLNFQAAFSTAELAGLDALKRLSKSSATR